MDRFFHSVTLDSGKCMGCTNCIKRCPTEAIRVRDGKACIISERCIDCGECIRVCPHHAKRATYDSLEILDKYPYTIALPAPSFMAQFNNLEDMTGRYGEIFDSAHNEYIQYLVTMGPTGLLAYLVFHVTAFWNIVRKRIENPIFMAILFAVFCYAAQAAVNINQPIATPVMWTLLSIGCVKNDRA